MTLMLQEIKQQPEVLSKLEAVNKDTLLALSRQVREKGIRHIIFAGRGTSDHAAIYGQYLLGMTCGMLSGSALPSVVTLYGAKLDFSDTLVIGVSQSGKAADAIAVLEQAREFGALTVAVTNDETSPMAKAAAYHLFCAAGPEISVAATKTFTAQLGIMYLLAAYLSENKEMLEEFNKLPELIAKLDSDCDETITALATRFRYIRDGFVLSRGISYPIALESTLKLQETCYVRMKGYAVSDFYHGPLAQVDRDVPIIVYEGGGHAETANREMITRLNEIGVEPLVVTADAEYAAAQSLSFVIPDSGCELIRPFLFAVFAQRFAEALCAVRGLNPDAPRNLKKVTITR